MLPDTLKCICIHFDASDYCKKLKCAILDNLPRIFLNIHFRGTHVFKNLFSIKIIFKLRPSRGLSDNFENFIHIGIKHLNLIFSGQVWVEYKCSKSPFLLVLLHNSSRSILYCIYEHYILMIWKKKRQEKIRNIYI